MVSISTRLLSLSWHGRALSNTKQVEDFPRPYQSFPQAVLSHKPLDAAFIGANRIEGDKGIFFYRFESGSISSMQPVSLSVFKTFQV